MKAPKEKTSTGHKILTVIGIVLCVILIPVLIINCTLIVKSYVNDDEVPTIGGFAPLIVLTDSMYPEIHAGDIIIVKSGAPEDVQKGDVIAFFDPASKTGAIVTHRVLDISTNKDGELIFQTKGDANNAADKLWVNGSKLVGSYKLRVPGMGNVAMFMQTTTGLIVCVVLPLLLLIGYDVIRRKRYDKRKDNDTAALLAELEALRAGQAEAPAAPAEEAPAAPAEEAPAAPAAEAPAEE